MKLLFLLSLGILAPHAYAGLIVKNISDPVKPTPLQTGTSKTILPSTSETLPPTSAGLPVTASDPVCEGGKKVNETWKDGEFEYVCQLNRSGMARTVVVACTNRAPWEGSSSLHSYYIPLGTTGFKFGEGRFKCVRTGLPWAAARAKLEYIPPTCEDGKRKAGEEWVEGNFVKSCDSDQSIADGDEVIVVVKACIVDSVRIPVGEKGNTFAGECECVIEKTRRGLQPTAAKIRCNESLGSTLPTEGVTTPEEITSSTAEPTCENGKKAGEEFDELLIIYVCRADDDGKLRVFATACYHIEGAAPPHPVQLGQTVEMPSATVTCKPTEDGKAVLESVPRVYKCDNGRKLNEEWKEGNLLKACEAHALLNDGVVPIIVVRKCITEDGEIPLGQTKTTRSGLCKCKDPNNVKPFLGHYQYREANLVCSNVSGSVTEDLVINPPEIEGMCEGGRNMFARTLSQGVMRIVNRNCQEQALYCAENGLKDIIKIGESARVNGVQYRCEKRGEKDAELVVKLFQHLCEEGDPTIEAWIQDGVLRDCVRPGDSEKPFVRARICILDGERIIEIGQTFETEFEIHSCERYGENDAELTLDDGRIHAEYFTTNNTCKNGRKIGDEWTENKHIRRACRKTKEGAVLFNLGCVIDDGRIIPVGRTERWTVPATADSKEFTRTLECRAGKEGFPPDALKDDIGPADEGRVCENDRLEGAEWEDRNVLRTCKEVNDKLVVAAIRCVFGNDSLEIGQVMPASEVSNIECIRVGEFDAAAVIGIAHDRVCDNGKKLNEEWTDFQVRKACRVRDQRATIVAIGCVLKDGRIFSIGEEEGGRLTKPGYFERHSLKCVASDRYGAELKIESARSSIREDKKSPCGENKHEAVWVKDRFLKKCKVIEGNYLSGVTIGCVTLKNTHLLEGEVIVENDYEIKCNRGEDGKLAIHYSLTLTEE